MENYLRRRSRNMHFNKVSSWDDRKHIPQGQLLSTPSVSKRVNFLLSFAVRHTMHTTCCAMYTYTCAWLGVRTKLCGIFFEVTRKNRYLRSRKHHTHADSSQGPQRVHHAVEPERLTLGPLPRQAGTIANQVSETTIDIATCI